MEKIKIYIDNVYTRVEGASHDTEFAIWNELSFQIEEFGSEHIRHRHLFNRKTKKTYTGLLNWITKILDERHEDYEIIDTRIAHAPNANFKLVDEVAPGVPFKLRPYQEEIVNRAEPRECIQAATGAGKTAIMAALIAKFNVKPVSVFADKLSLCTQIKEEFEKFLGVPVGLVGGGINQREDITVYSLQSTTEDDVKDSKMILYDECLTYDTLVLMEDGSYRKIGELVEEKSEMGVMSYNHMTGKVEIKKIISHSKTPLSQNYKKLMKLKVRTQNGTIINIECTDNHKIWVDSLSQYAMAKDLIKGQKVIIKNDALIIGIIEEIEYIDMTDEEYEQIFVYDIGVEDNHNFFANDLLVHNCHHVPADTANTVSQWCKNAYYRIGVSATPWRDGGDDLLIEAVLAKRKPENNINASYLIKNGYLVPTTIYFVPMKQVFKGKNYHNVYQQAIVDNEERNKAIVTIATKMLQTKKMTTLILIQRVEHGEKIQEMLFKKIPQKTFTITVDDPKNGKPTMVRVKNIEFLSGQDEALRRKAVIQAIKEKKCQILIGSTIADEGLDIPSLDCLILAGGGKSSTRAFQRIGRVLRLFKDKITGEEKKRAVCFDFQDYTPMLRRHARIREKLYKTEDMWDIKQLNPGLLEE